MRYENIEKGIFLERPNRFVALVDINGRTERVHVKNTGRCRELLVPGTEVWLSRSDDPERKTAYDLITVLKPGLGLVNIDSQAPNRAALEWLQEQSFSVIRPEYTYGGSRLDFYMEIQGRPMLMEVKGCTLEIDGVGYFPDAPTQRGIKHLNELAGAASKGISSYLAFVIPMPAVMKVLPNMDTAPEFGRALLDARKAGVKVIFLPCAVKEDELHIDNELVKKINADVLSDWGSR